MIHRPIREQTKFWDSEMRNIWDLVTLKGYRAKDLAKHYGVKPNSILAVLYRREVSLVRWRHDAANGKPFTWEKANPFSLNDIHAHVYKQDKLLREQAK